MEIYITESGPHKNGIKLYNNIKQYTKDVYLINDISLAYFIEKIDYVIIGS